MRIKRVFIPGRCIAENVRLIYDVLFETKKQELPGLILSVDFEKSVPHGNLEIYRICFEVF